MRKYIYSLTMCLFLLPAISLGGASVTILADFNEAWSLFKLISGSPVRAKVAPWGLRTRIGGGGSIIGGNNWLWLAVKKWPDGKLLFLHNDGRLSEAPAPYRTITSTGFDDWFHYETPEFEISPAIPEGLYVLYAVLTTRPTDVFNESTWDAYPDSSNIFIRSELNLEEWESKGWSVYGPE